MTAHADLVSACGGEICRINYCFTYRTRRGARYFSLAHVFDAGSVAALASDALW